MGRRTGTAVAVDGHAKNFSLFLERGGRYVMAPLYDVLSVWPYLDSPELPRRKATLAMGWHGTNRHYRLTDVMPRHVRATAARCRMAEALPDILEHLAARLPDAIERTGKEAAGDVPTSVSGPVFDGATNTLAKLVDALL